MRGCLISLGILLTRDILVGRHDLYRGPAGQFGLLGKAANGLILESKCARGYRQDILLILNATPGRRRS